MKVHIIFFQFLIAVLCSDFPVHITADIHQMLHHFETLDSSDLHVVTRKRRDADGTLSRFKHISFETLGRNFKMVLTPGSSVIGPNFQATTIENDGRMETFFVDPNNFYTGFLEDDINVKIDAHYEDGILSSSIHFPHETYVTEPAWRHRLTSTNVTMIAYRHSDVNWEEIVPTDPKTGKRTRMIDGVRLSSVIRANSEGTNSSEKNDKQARHRREAGNKNCPLITIADFQFFRDMGNRKRGTTAAFIISTIQNVNRLYRQTVWDSIGEYVNMGFIIAEMMIHTEFTTDPPNHYNADKDWDYNEKLKAFSTLRKIQNFCLGHLLTSYAFKDNILGLSFIASEEHSYAGGICSLPTELDGVLIYPRTSWSSAKNSHGQPVISMQYLLVVTHELVTIKCNNQGTAGDLIMTPPQWIVLQIAMENTSCGPPLYLVTHFSPCSKRSVSTVLKSKASLCFQAATGVETLCGNGIIEINEQCDHGFLEEGEEDACCTKDCQLRDGATCSDFNLDCCKDCQVANTSVMCGERNELACKDETFCDGHSLECPLPNKLPDYTPCIDSGLCFNGTCLNFCVVQGRREGIKLVPCLCTQNTTAMCQRCCAEVHSQNKGECLPTRERLDAGRSCLLGYCDENGQCITVESKVISHIFKFIRQLTVSKLLDFMRSNIVGTIIILSLIIWIPPSLIISVVDRRKKRLRLKEMEYRASLANAVTMPPSMKTSPSPGPNGHRKPEQGTQDSHSPHPIRNITPMPQKVMAPAQRMKDSPRSPQQKPDCEGNTGAGMVFVDMPGEFNDPTLDVIDEDDEDDSDLSNDMPINAENQDIEDEEDERQADEENETEY